MSLASQTLFIESPDDSRPNNSVTSVGVHLDGRAIHLSQLLSAISHDVSVYTLLARCSVLAQSCEPILSPRVVRVFFQHSSGLLSQALLPYILVTLWIEPATLRSEIAELDALTEPTEEQAARFTAALAEWDTKKSDHDALVERAEKVAAVRAASLNPRNVEPGFSAPQIQVKRDPFEDMAALRFVGVAFLSATAGLDRAA